MLKKLFQSKPSFTIVLLHLTQEDGKEGLRSATMGGQLLDRLWGYDLKNRKSCKGNKGQRWDLEYSDVSSDDGDNYGQMSVLKLRLLYRNFGSKKDPMRGADTVILMVTKEDLQNPTRLFRFWAIVQERFPRALMMTYLPQDTEENQEKYKKACLALFKKPEADVPLVFLVEDRDALKVSATFRVIVEDICLTNVNRKD